MKILDQHSRLYQISSPIIAITGGIGSGKSTFTKLIEDRGGFVISADSLVKKIYDKKESKNFIKVEFPDCISNDAINFKKLREIVFKDSQAKDKIEKFIYPQMEETFKNELIHCAPNQIIFYDVPLLFERNLAKLVDASVVIYVDKATQIARLTKRDQIKEDLAEKILENQLPLSKKRELADYVVDNSGSVDDLLPKFLAFESWLKTFLKDEYKLSKS